MASSSPRRRRLIEWLGLRVDTASVDTPESLDSPLASSPGAMAASLAEEKWVAAAAEGLARDSALLTFDTLVVLDGKLLGKPADEADAWRMLRALAGRTHQVVTGVALGCPSRAAVPETFWVTTDVTMNDLTDEHIVEWMSRDEYLGCAGAYNIEAQVAKVTEDECYQNVAGLPLCHVYSALRGPATAGCLRATPASPVVPCDAALSRSCRLGPRLVADASSRG